MDKLRNMKSVVCVCFAVLIIAVIAVTAVCAVGEVPTAESLRVPDEPKTEDFYGTYTFRKEMILADGSVAEFYESGDQYFKYCHDGDGYVLLRDNERLTLEYAVNDGGRPVSSGVSFNAGAREINAVPRMTADEIDLEANPDLAIQYDFDGMQEVDIEPLLGSGTTGTIVNLVIFITFNDVSFSPGAAMLDMFNGSGNSLNGYYKTMSNNAVDIKSICPYESSAIYVYKDSRSRSYYNTDGIDRQTKEATLLTNAVAAAKEHFSGLESYDLDVNGDEYLDSLSFVIGGDSSSTWGSLLWPHSWNLDSIDGAGNSTITGKNGDVKVGKYSFNFASELNTGVVCHEMGHVLGAPDLYHYNYDYVPVGQWDLMQFNLDTPQYMLTYMRDKYVGGIKSTQIEDIVANGVYSLAPVSTATSPNAVLAYRIPTTHSGEYFMLEYRKVTSGGFDSGISGSGLIIYRIKEPSSYANSEGNQNSVYHGTGKTADEVYVFRPSIKHTGKESSSLRYENSKYDVEYAYLSPNNPYFSEVGTTNVQTKYSAENLFFTDGSNSGIVIKALSVSGTSIEFSVQMSDSTEIPNDYFKNKISVKEATLTNNTEYAGVLAKLELSTLNITYLSELKLELLDEQGNVISTNTANPGKLIAEYKSGTRIFDCNFVYADKGNAFSGVFGTGGFLTDDEPTFLRVRVTDADGDEVTVTTVRVEDTANIGWDTVLGSKTERKAMISASATMTAGVKRTGSVVAVGSLSGAGMLGDITDAVSASAGYSHMLVLRNNLTVTAIGSDKYGESSVASWTDIKAVVAGYYVSYGLKTDGTVVGAGSGRYGQLAVEDWTNVVAISTGGKRVAGVTKDGKVLYAGSLSDTEKSVLDGITSAKAVACGTSFIAVLLDDGSVVTAGSLAGNGTSTWSNVASISAGAYHLLGLTTDGEVLATGDNTYNQCYVSNLYDTIAISAGESHSAFLRADGVVEYRGLDKNGYGIDDDLGNLIYSSYSAVNAISGVTVNGQAQSTVRIPLGGEVTVSVSYTPRSATYARMVFNAVDTSVVGVSASGMTTATLTGSSVGTTKLAIYENGSKITSSVTVEVYKESALEGISFADTTKSVLKGGSVKLVVDLIPQDAVTVGEITYSCDNEDVATVSDKGVLTVAADAEDGAACTVTATLGRFTATCTIKVVSDITSATVDVSGGKTVFRYGEELDTDGYIIRLVLDGKTETAHVTPDMVSGYDATDTSSIRQTLTVTYMGATATCEVAVRDYVTSVELESLPVTEYKYGEDLSANGSYKIVYATGKEEIRSFNIADIGGYDKKTIGTQYLTYTHTDIEWNEKFVIRDMEVTVRDYVQSIQYKPAKNVYCYGEAPDGMEQVELAMASGAVRYANLEDCDVHDLSSPVTDKADAMYALYSKRVGAHKLEIAYTDALTKETKTANAVVSVELSGEYVFNGKEKISDGSYVYYYEVGGELYVEIGILQKDGSFVSVSSDVQDALYYLVYGRDEQGSAITFDNTTVGKKKAIVRVYVASQTLGADGNAQVGEAMCYEAVLDVYGTAKAKTIEIAPGAVTEYMYGQTINANTAEPDIALRLTLEGDVKQDVLPMEIRYDSELLGTQTIQIRYLSTWLELDITIKDYVLGFTAENVTSVYGEAPVFEVYATYASLGKVKLKSSEYTLGTYYIDRVGAQTVTATLKGDTSFSDTFTLTVEDAFASIAVTEPPKTEYLKGEKFDPTSKYIITMRSGATVGVDYNSNDFRYSPEFVSTSIENVQRITIYYNSPSGDVAAWYGDCVVPNYVKELVVLTGYTKYEYKYGEALVTKIRADLANGASNVLADTAYTTDYDPKKIGVQKVTVTYVYKGKTYHTYIENVRVTDTVYSIKVTEPTIVNLRYGAPMSFAGATATVKYASGGTVVYTGEEIRKNLEVSYSTVKEGYSDVVVTAGGVSASFRIQVGKPSAIMTVKDDAEIKFDFTGRTVAATEPMSVADITSHIECATYLTAYVLANGTESLAEESAALVISTGTRLVYKNAEGTEVFVFTLYVRGEANGDGVVDASDVEKMAEDMVMGKTTVAVTDYNGNGTANLTDIVNWARETGGGPSNSPVKELADIWVSDVKPRRTREDGNEEE